MAVHSAGRVPEIDELDLKAGGAAREQAGVSVNQYLQSVPIFLAVVGGAFTSRDYLAASAQFLLYALGMSAVVAGVTFALAAFRDAVITRARRAMLYVQPASAALLLLAGAFITYYSLTLGGRLSAAFHLALSCRFEGEAPDGPGLAVMIRL
jgi:hypothetical protein